MDGKFVTYYRVSTTSQGVHGLGMEAQRSAVTSFLNGGDWTVVDEYEEVESGKRADRPELAKAIAKAKATGAKLLIAKLDRLARDLHFLTTLEKQGVEFVAADMPGANRFTLHVLMAMAQQEREMISARTKAALESIKGRIERHGHHVTKAGKTIDKLGSRKPMDAGVRDRGRETIKARADHHARTVNEIIRPLRESGQTLQAIADRLNKNGLTTPRGKAWTPIAVDRAAKR